MTKELIKEYLKVAAEKLASAQLLLQNEKYDDAVSRAYYAVYHCAQALLLSEGLQPQTHTGVRNMFNLHFIKTGKLDKKFAKYLKELKEDREAGDYGILTSLDEAEARQGLTAAEEFFKETKKILG